MIATLSIVAQLSIVTLYGLLAYACLSDVAKLRIPNAVPLAILLLFALYAAAARMGVGEVFRHVAAGATVLAVTFLLYAAGGKFGGGDAKLLSALSVWCGFEQLPPLLIDVSFCGGGLAILVLLLRQFGIPGWFALHGWRIPALLREKNRPCLPYGVAIAGGFLVAISAA